LEINTPVDNVGLFISDDGGSSLGNGEYIDLRMGASNTRWAGLRQIFQGGANVNHLAFMVGYADSIKEAMRINHSCNVGIGTGTEEPKAKLDVNGDINVAGGVSSQGGRVRRDFVTWNTNEENNYDPIHIKTNIPIHSNVMYRILVEGYNYGSSAAICSDVVGYSWSGSGTIHAGQSNNYADGVSISQYYSSDGFVVIKLASAKTYYLGFSASAWLTNPTGTAFDISAIKIVQQPDEL
jgi:hypothetical protein